MNLPVTHGDNYYRGRVGETPSPTEGRDRNDASC